MRMLPLLPRLLAALCLSVAATPAFAGSVPTPSQCADLGAVYDYYGGTSHFQNYGLGVEQCRALCRKNGARCKASLKSALACALKAIDGERAIDKRTQCDPLPDPAQRRACVADLKQDAENAKASFRAEAQTLLDCEFVSACSAECGG